MALTIGTVGHGTLSAEDFTRLVTAAGIETVVDVRRFPSSRRNPQFRGTEMARWLAAGTGTTPRQVGYHWLPALGGRRTPAPDSPHLALRNPQFRAYADHMGTVEFAAGVSELLALARATDAVAVMCAESVWWRCHRRLLADHLVLVEGVEVEHLMHDGRRQPHVPTAEARRIDERVVYAGAQTTLFDT